MKKSSIIKYTAIGMVVGGGLGTLLAPKKSIRCTAVKAAKAIGGMVDNITDLLGL